MKKHIELPKEVKEYCIGFFLGDGYLFKIKNGNNCSLKIGHGLKQENYLIWKHKLLNNLSREIKYTRIDDKRRNKVYHIKSFETRTHKFFTRYWELLYHKGKKKLPERILKQMTLITLAAWIMDDGCLSENNKKRRTTNWNYTLATHCFSVIEIQLLLRYLEEKFGLEGKMHRDRDKFKLWFNTTNSIKLANLIKPYVPECMEYKVKPILERYIVRGE